MMKQQVYIYPGSDHVFQALLDDARNVDGIQIVDSIFSNNSIESIILYLNINIHVANLPQISDTLCPLLSLII